MSREEKRRRLRPEERAAIMHLDMLKKSYEYCAGQLQGRLGGYRYLKRDLGFMKHACNALIDEALKGEEPETADHIRRQSRDWRLGIERVSPVRRKDEVVMPIEDEWQMIHIVLESRCGLCLKGDGESAQCPIRKLLRKYCDEPESGTLRGCGYQGCDLNDNVKSMNRPERL